MSDDRGGPVGFYTDITHRKKIMAVTRVNTRRMSARDLRRDDQRTGFPKPCLIFSAITGVFPLLPTLTKRP